jgi:hypothetical protein
MRQATAAAGARAPSSRRALLRLGGWAAGLIALVGGSALSAPQGARAQGRSLEGTWVVNVNRAGLPPITAFFTFAAGGGLTHTDSAIRGAATSIGGVASFGPSHGVWAPAGGRTFEYRWERLMFDATGVYSGIGRVRGQITLDEDGNGYTANSMSETLNLQGEVLVSSQNTSRATRMTLDAG